MRSAYGEEWQNDGLFADLENSRPVLVAYSDSGLNAAKSFLDWKSFATRPYVSSTHGEMFVVNYANDEAADAYGKYEEIGSMPRGGAIAKPSFTVSPEGRATLGPLFLMEKMRTGWHAPSNDWRYTTVTPQGKFAGRTRGTNSAGVQYCAECHAAVSETQDSLFFLPEEVRVK